MTPSIQWLAAYGLILDIVGAAWTAKALAFSSTRDLMDQASTKWDISKSVFRSLEHERLDVRCGLAILTVGFAMQLAALYLPSVPWWTAALLAALVLAAAVAYYVPMKRAEDASREERCAKYVGKMDQVNAT
jgi:hypothetical protein